MTTELAHSSGLAAQLRVAAAEAADIALAGRRLKELGALLVARGLKVMIRPAAITVSNPAAIDLAAPQDRATNPGLTQSVLLRTTDNGLVWYGTRPDLRDLYRRGGPRPRPAIGRLCPGDDIHQAAKRIAQAVGLDQPGG